MSLRPENPLDDKSCNIAMLVGFKDDGSSNLFLGAAISRQHSNTIRENKELCTQAINAFENVVPPPKVFASDCAFNNRVNDDAAFPRLNAITHVVKCLPHAINNILVKMASGMDVKIGGVNVNFVNCIKELLIIDQATFSPLTKLTLNVRESGYR